jgi:hypothetical protein
MKGKDPYTDETVQERVDPTRTLFVRLRSEECTGSLTNTAAEVAQHLRRMRCRRPAVRPGEATHR